MSKRKCDSGKTGGPKTESNGIHQNSSEVGPKMGRWIPGSEHQETESQDNAKPCLAIRTSARVLRKKEERKESEGSSSSSTSAAEPPPSSLLWSSSTGGNGHGSQESSLPGGHGTTHQGTSASHDASGGPETGSTPPREEKRRRTWEQWSSEDKATFFEALSEFGKNFESIQSYFQAKSRTKKTVVFKNKEQIRTFYYRTWKIVAKVIDFPTEIKKSSRELYGLINYGELWKKIRGSALDDKNGSKLHELVMNGTTSVRVKGKTYRIRTPICRALKRISNKLEGIGNQATADIIPQSSGSHRPSGSTHHNSLIYSCYTSHKVAHGHNSARIPEKVNVILKPLQEQDFARVHGQCLQNPHVLIKVGLEKKLKSVIELLQKKWTPPAPVTNASFHSSYNKKQSFSSQVQLAEVPEPTSASEELWILSQPGSKITMPKMRTVEPITSVTLSLSNVQAKLLNRQSQIKKEEDASKEQIQGDSGNSKSSASSAHSDASNGRAGEKIKLEDQSEDGASSSNASKDTSAEEDESEPAWNIIKAKDLTLGQLYVILGDKDKKSVELCYTWRPRKESIAAVSTGSEKVPSLNLADKSFIKSTMSNLSLLASEEVVSKSQSKILNGGSPMPSRKPENGVSKSPFNGLTSASSIGGHTTATSSKSSASTATVATKEPGSPLATPIVEVPTSPKKEGSEFRRPAPPSLGRPLAMSTGSGSGSQGAANQQAEAFRQQLNQFLPKFSNRRGRPLSRNIAKRTIFPNRQIQARQMIQGPDGKMKMKLLPNNRSSPLTVQQGQQLQLQQQQLQQRLQQQQQQQSVHIHQQIPTLAIVVPAAVPEPQHFTVALNAAAASVQTTNSNNSISALQIPQISIPDSTTPPPQSFANNGARAISPTGSFASLLDSVSDLNTPINSTTTSPSKGDHFLNSVLEPSNSSLLQTPSRESTTPPMSPSLNNEDSSSSFNLSFSSFLRFNESSSNGGGGSPVPPKASSKPPVDFLQFGDGDAARNSDQAKNGLNPSSFLSHHLSDASTPVKVITNGAIQGTSNMHSSSSTAILNLNEDSAQSTTSEVDRQLNSMLNENSIDFTNKFAKLASHVLNEGN